MKGGYYHQKGTLLPSLFAIKKSRFPHLFSDNIVPVTRIRTVTPVRILFADKFRFLQILYSSADCTWRKRKLPCDCFNARPTLFLFVTSVIKINVNRLCPVRQVFVFIKFSVVRHSITSVCPHRKSMLRFFGNSFIFYTFFNLTFRAYRCMSLCHFLRVT